MTHRLSSKSFGACAMLISFEMGVVTIGVLLVLILMQMREVVKLLQNMLAELETIKDYSITHKTLLECLVDPHVCFAEEQLAQAGANVRPGPAWNHPPRRHYD